MSDIIDKSGRVVLYWICDECAMKRDWTCDKTGITVIKGLCGHCENTSEVMLTPTRDFDKPRPERL